MLENGLIEQRGTMLNPSTDCSIRGWVTHVGATGTKDPGDCGRDR